MQPEPPRFSLAELEEASGVASRLIRSYITEGLVPPALGRGRSRYFTSDHLQRVELVSRMRANRLSFDEIRLRISAETMPHDPDAETWRRVSLHPDLELHVRDGASDSIDALVHEVIDLSRRWFGEE
jgi:DNA-binding transcriptional MerR regulator